jgi:hypothetical protein
MKEDVMMHLRRHALPLALVWLCRSSLAAAPPAVSAPTTVEPGTAHGQLTVAGKITPLSFAYARAGKGFFDPTKEDVLIILSDVPIAEEALEDEFARHRLAAEGKLHGVEVTLNEEKQPISGGLLHEAFSKMQGYVSVTGMHQFEPTTFEPSLVEGKLFMSKPGEFFSTTFEYTATFRASVWRRAPPTANGAAAAETPAGKATLAFLKTARSGNKTAIQNLMTAEAAKELDGPRGKEALELLKISTPDPKTSRIESVDIRADTAKVEVVEKSENGSVTSHFTLILEGGRWKIGSL